MKVEKLQLKHLCGYLPYGLQVRAGMIEELTYDVLSIIPADGVLKVATHIEGQGILFMGMSQYNLKPMLRPISQLTQEITHNGETFVPLIRLAAIAGTSSENCWYINKENRAQFNNSTATFHLAYDNSFIFRESEKWKDFGVPAKQLELYKMIHEWMFDLYSLLSSGLALELTNPLQTKQ